jgi:hypothetical protein
MGVAVGLGVGVAVGLGVAVGTRVGVGLIVGVGVGVGIRVGEGLGVRVNIDVGAGVALGLGVRVGIGVLVGLGVGVGVRVGMGVAVGIGVGVAWGLSLSDKTGGVKANTWFPVLTIWLVVPLIVKFAVWFDAAVTTVMGKWNTSKEPVGGLGLSSGDSATTTVNFPVELAVCMLVFSTTVFNALVVTTSPERFTFCGSKAKSSRTKATGAEAELNKTEIVLSGGKVAEAGEKEAV